MAKSIILERVEEKDLDELTTLLHANKLDLSINRLIIKDWPNDEAQRKLYRGALEGALHSTDIEDWKAVDNETGAIAGYVAYTVQRPKTEDTMPSRGPEDAVPEGVVPEVFKAITQATNVITRATPNVERIGIVYLLRSPNLKTSVLTTTELVYIGVQRTYRNRGIGSQLLGKCLAAGKELQLPVILHAEPVARAFFEHHKFQEFAHGEVDLGRFAPPFSGFGLFRLTGMSREATGQTT